MYLMAKNDRNARRMVLIPLIGTIIGPMIWFIPSMAATITHPNLAAEYPNLPQPHEAAFVAVAHDVMPVGLMGLLVCAMLGATLTSMDAGLNKNVGVFVRSFYCPIISPRAGEKHLLWVGKVSTLIFGVVVIAIALEVNKLRTVGLFQLTNLLAATLLMPMALPLLYGLFLKRTPSWAAWSTALVGFIVAYICNYHINLNHLAEHLGLHTPLRNGETDDFKLGVVTISTVCVGTIWYLGTSLFFPLTSTEEKDRLQRFFTRLATPIDSRAEGILDMDEIIYRTMGLLCLVFGTFVLSLAIIVPNAVIGRLCFVFCGGSIFTMGGVLFLRSRVLSHRRLQTAARLVSSSQAAC